ncbi:HNH endonuclease [Mycolicibacterium sp. A43C]
MVNSYAGQQHHRGRPVKINSFKQSAPDRQRPLSGLPTDRSKSNTHNARCRQPAPKGKPCCCHPTWEGSTHPGGSRRWTNFRAAKLRHDPLCQWNEDGTRCRRRKVEVDHRVPLDEDPSRRYDWSNVQSLCHQHHAEKTTADALRGKKRLR